MRTIFPETISGATFSPYGDFIGWPDKGTGISANKGTAIRFDGIAGLALSAAGGHPELSYFRVQPASLPLVCHELERHPLSSQMFMPVGFGRFLVIVALGEEKPNLDTLRVFVTDGKTGVNYATGTWHHAAVALGDETDFLVLGRARKRSDEDVEFFTLPEGERFAVAP